jgi:hypothetical protein
MSGERMRLLDLLPELVEDVRREERRRIVLSTLEVRFGPAVVKGLEEIVNRVEILDELRDLLTLAVRCRRVSQFRRVVMKR